VALATACLVALVIGAAVAAFAAAVVMSGTPALDTLAGRLDEEAFYSTPVGFLVNNLLLAALIPAAMVAVWVVHRWRPRWVASVRPGLRWGWMLECTAWSLVFVGGLFVAGLLVDGPIDVDPEQQALAFVVVIALTTPLQAAGEEYGFRGLLTQAIGSWFARPVLGAVVAGAVTATLFALAHGSQSPWLFADRFAFGAVASYLVWRTGGLEAGIALHTVNNLYAIGVSVLTGTLAESLTATDYPAVAAILDVVLMLALAAALTWRAHRRGLARVHDPAAQPDRFRGRPPQVAWAAYRG
jgi:membrane protease YdiL (CAAX protease family)